MPGWLLCLQAVAVIVIPVIGAWLAWQQVQIARVKLQHDLYDRRYRVFDAARRLLAEIGVHRSPSEEAVRAFVLGTSDAPFLFDDDLTSYLKDIQRRALEMKSQYQMLHATDSNSMPIIQVGEQRANASNAANEHWLWLVEQLDGTVDKFKPFLKLDKAASTWWFRLIGR
jgi:hypothetical protein